MSKESLYMALPFDLSGSRTKNRFRIEMLWGLEKIFDVYQTGVEFDVVFDYVCDIEVHLFESLEFYQIKTHNNTQPTTLNEITKADKANKSILGKLYLLKHRQNDGKILIKIAIVSNVPLKDSTKKVHSTIPIVELSTLQQCCKDVMSNKLKSELKEKHDIDFDNIFYIHTAMNLIDPNDTLIGKTAKFFEKVKGIEPIKPISLYRLFFDTVSSKASYELECSNYSEIINKKGINRNCVDEMLLKHFDLSDEAVLKAKEHIEKCWSNDFQELTKQKKGLTKITTTLLKSRGLQKIENKISKYIEKNISSLPNTKEEIIDYLCGKFNSQFSIEYQPSERRALILLVLTRYEEGVYEKFNCK